MRKEQAWVDLKEDVDEAAVARIVAAVKCPADLDKVKLHQGLREVYWRHRAGLLLREKPAKQRRQRIRIMDLARQLRGLLADGGPLLTKKRPHHIYRDALDELIADVKETSALLERGPEIGLGKVSAFEYTVSLLQKVFEKHFRISHKYTKLPDNNVVKGPAIDFVAAALQEFGVLNAGRPYERRAIADAMTRARG
jgi:hypothetical protein